VSPGEVEAALLSHGGVRECAVLGEPHAALGEAIVAFVVLTEPGAADPDELRRHCVATLPPVKRPARIVAVEELPRTATGKVDARALRSIATG
jgi:acyl-coenzyme A synthetase/AMP-(fatty) acid ligase